MSLSINSELTSRSLLKLFAASLSVLYIYIILGTHYYNINHQQATISVVNFSYVRFLWSTYTDIIFPNIMVHNSFRVTTILKVDLFGRVVPVLNIRLF